MSFPSVSAWKWWTGHRVQYSSPSSSPPCSSSPPTSPHSGYSQYQARVQSSPSPGYCINVHDPSNGASNWFRRELHPIKFPHPKVPCKLPSFHSMFGDLPPPMSDVEEYPDVANTHCIHDDTVSSVPPSHASVFYTDSEEEDHDPEDEVVETSPRATFFRVSEERGQWKNDPIPFQPPPSHHQRNSMPTSSRPVPPSPDRRLASEPAEFSMNPNHSSREDLDFTFELSPESDDRQASYDADIDSELITSESEMPDDDNRPYSPLPPSSPPLSPMSFSVSPMIGPTSPSSVSALPPLSPVIISPLRSDDTDVEGIHLPVATDPSLSPLVQTKYEIPPFMIPEMSIKCGAELDTITAVISAPSSPSSDRGLFDKDQRLVPPPPALSVATDTDVNASIEDSAVLKEDLSDDVAREQVVNISDVPTKQEVLEMQDQVVEVTLKEKNGVDDIAAVTMGHEKRKKGQDDGPKKKKARLDSHSTSSGAVGDDENTRTASKSETKIKTKARKPRKQAQLPRRRRRQPSYSSSDEEDEEPAKRQPPPPPPLNFSVEDAELCGMIIESMATSRASSHRASSIYKAVIQNRPALKSQREDPEWIAAIRRILEEAHCVNGMFGKVESSGMDDSNRPLEAQWFYVLERDEDQERASLMRAMMPRPAKRSETKKYKQYYYRPLGKISRWDSEDAL
ncbi:hypothetical protein DFS33DRAFT_1288003 [Desarmillaria ectypa]|nr:hypothetical protein DFS33DRAFT_1288003 [Desarmillaria ectypa]